MLIKINGIGIKLKKFADANKNKHNKMRITKHQWSQKKKKKISQNMQTNKTVLLVGVMEQHITIIITITENTNINKFNNGKHM